MNSIAGNQGTVLHSHAAAVVGAAASYLLDQLEEDRQKIAVAAGLEAGRSVNEERQGPFDSSAEVRSFRLGSQSRFAVVSNSAQHCCSCSRNLQYSSLVICLKRHSSLRGKTAGRNVADAVVVDKALATEYR